MCNLDNKTNYIYLLQLQKSVKAKENIYKIGMTKQNNLKRFHQYPKGSILLFQTICKNCNNMERKIINIFKNKFTRRKDFGNEYFEGDYNTMIDIINQTVKQEFNESQNNTIFDIVEENNNIIKSNEKINVINCNGCPLEKFIQIIYCGNYHQYKNLIVTDMKSEYIYKYDDINGVFVIANKNEVLNQLVDKRLNDLEIMYNEFIHTIDNYQKIYIESIINKIKNTNDEYIDEYGNIYKNFKQYKINNIQKLLFNHKDEIINDLYNIMNIYE